MIFAFEKLLSPQKTSRYRQASSNTRSSTAHYRPYINHAACIKHHLWWRSPKLLWIAAASAFCGLVGITSATAILPSIPVSGFFINMPSSGSSGSAQELEKKFQSYSLSGQTLIKIGKLSEGLSKLAEAESLTEISNHLKAETFNDVAMTLHEAEQTKYAVIYLEKSIKADSSLVTARRNLAMILFEMGEKQKAISVLREAIRVNPDNRSLIRLIQRLQATS